MIRFLLPILFFIALHRIENGAYDKNWGSIHEFPEQTIQAINDINVKKVLPIHWGKFDLANHTWQEPIESLLKLAAPYTELQIATPKIGQVFNVFETLSQQHWWQDV